MRRGRLPVRNTKRRCQMAKLKRISFFLLAFMMMIVTAALFGTVKTSAASDDELIEFQGDVLRFGGSLSSNDNLRIDLDREGHILPYVYQVKDGMVSYVPQYSFDSGGNGFTVSYKLGSVTRNYGSGYGIYSEKMVMSSFKVNEANNYAVRTFTVYNAEVEVEQIIQYHTGLSYYDVMYTVKNLHPSLPMTDVKLYTGGATYVNGSDVITNDSSYNADSSRLSVQSDPLLKMYMQSSTVPTGYYAGNNTAYSSIIASEDLSNTIAASNNAGYYLQWKTASVNSKETYSVKLIEGFVKSSHITVYGSGTQTATPGTTVNLQYDVTVKDTGMYSFNVMSKMSNTVTIDDYSGSVQLTKDVTTHVVVSVEITEVVPKPVIDTISFTVVSDDAENPYAASCETALDINGLSPNIVDMSFDYDYDKDNKVVKSVTLNFTPINVETGVSLTAEILDADKQSFINRKLAYLDRYEGGSVSLRITECNLDLKTGGEYYVQIRIKSYEKIDLTMKIEDVPVTGIKITKYPSMLYTGNSTVLSAATMPASAIDNKLVWSVSGDAVVDPESGLLTVGSSVGTITVTATHSGTQRSSSVTIIVEQGVASFDIVGLPGIGNDGYIEIERAKSYSVTADYAPSNIISASMIKWELVGEGVTFDKNILAVGHNSAIGNELIITAYPPTNAELEATYKLRIVENRELTAFKTTLGLLSEDTLLYSQIKDVDALFTAYNHFSSDIKLHVTAEDLAKMNRLKFVGAAIIADIQKQQYAFRSLQAMANEGENNLIPNFDEFKGYKALLDSMKQKDASKFNCLTAEYDGIVAILADTQSLYDRAVTLKTSAQSILDEIKNDGGRVIPNNRGSRMKTLSAEIAALLSTQRALCSYEKQELDRLIDKFNGYTSILSEIKVRFDALALLNGDQISKVGLIAKRNAIVDLQNYIYGGCTESELKDHGDEYINTYLQPALDMIDALLGEVNNIKQKLDELSKTALSIDVTLENAAWLKQLSTNLNDPAYSVLTQEQCDRIEPNVPMLNGLLEKVQEYSDAAQEVDKLIGIENAAIAALGGENGMIAHDAAVKEICAKYDKLTREQKKLIASTENYDTLIAYHARIEALINAIDAYFNALTELDVYTDAETKNFNDTKLLEISEEISPNVVEQLESRICLDMETQGKFTAEQMTLLQNGVLTDIKNVKNQITHLVETVKVLIGKISADITTLENCIKNNESLISESNYTLYNRIKADLEDVSESLRGALVERFSAVTEQFDKDYRNVAALEKYIESVNNLRSYMTNRDQVNQILAYLSAEYDTNGIYSEREFELFKTKADALRELLTKANEAAALLETKRKEYDDNTVAYVEKNGSGIYIVRSDAVSNIMNLKTALAAYLAEFADLSEEMRTMLSEQKCKFDVISAEITRQENQVLSYIQWLIDNGFVVMNDDFTFEIKKVDGLIAQKEALQTKSNKLGEIRPSLYAPQQALADKILAGFTIVTKKIDELISQYETKDRLLIDDLKSLDIWQRNNGEVDIDESGNFKVRTDNENIYSAYESTIKSMLADVATLTSEQQSLMNVYRQSVRIKSLYEYLRKVVSDEISKINSMGIFDASNQVIADGLIGRDKDISTELGKIAGFTSEQIAEIDALYSRLAAAHTMATNLKAVVDRQNLLVAGCYSGSTIISEKLISKRADIERFRTLYEGGSLTSEQKNLLLVSYNKINAVITRINELERMVTQYKEQINTLVALGNNGDNGIIALKQQVEEMRSNFVAMLTQEQQQLLGTEYSRLLSLSTRITMRFNQVQDLKERYQAVIGQGDDGLIALYTTLENLVFDMGNTLRLTGEQIDLLTNERRQLEPLLARARELKNQVDEIVEKDLRGELYVKNKYGEGEIDKINALITRIEMTFTNEQQGMLADIVRTAKQDKAASEALRDQIIAFINAACELQIWESGKAPVFDSDVLPSLDMQAIMFLDADTAAKIVSVRSDITAGETNFTAEQRVDINATYAALKQAEELLAEYESLRDVLDAYKNLGVTDDNILSKQDEITTLSNTISSLPIESQQNIAHIVKKLEDYQNNIAVLYSQINMIKRSTREIQLYGNNVLSVGNELNILNEYLTKKRKFDNGKFITDEQLKVLQDEGISGIITEKLQLYSDLNAVIESINRDLSALDIKPDNLFLKKDGILAILNRINADDITIEQEYRLLGVKSQCELYLIEIEELDREIELVHQAVSAIDSNAQHLLSNEAEINRVYASAMALTEGQKNALRSDIDLLVTMRTRIELLKKQIADVVSRIDELRNAATRDRIIYMRAEIDALTAKLAGMYDEQKAQLELQQKYLEELKAEYNRQIAILDALVAQINALPVTPERSDYDTVIKVYNNYTVYAHKDLINDEVKQKLDDCFNALMISNLTDKNTGISVGIVGGGTLGKDVVLNVSVVNSDSGVYQLYQNMLIDMKFGNTVTNVYTVGLSNMPSGNYIKTVKMLAPGGFDPAKSKLLLVGEDGSMSEIEFTFSEGYIHFQTNNLGTFVIGTNKFIFPTVWLVIGILAVIALAVLIYLINRKVKKAKLKLEYDNGTVKMTIIPPTKRIMNLAIYVDSVLIEQHSNPDMVYYIDNVEDRTKITVYYDFNPQKTRFPRFITKVPSLKSASKVVKI